ncbi:MAG: hypothetical protein JW811_03295 [Clostridiales bacterium]|nr:hypothetical protein [Clostridiales bacterium]
MNIDIVEKNRELRRFREKSSFDAFFWAAFALLVLVSLIVFYREANAADSELALQSGLAAGSVSFESSIGSVSAPFWHISFKALYALGVPFAWAAAVVCTAYKLLGFVLVQRIVFLYLMPEANAKLATLAALVVTVSAAVRIPSLDPGVYTAAGSPAVWHDPAQIVGQLAAMLCLFYAAHCVFGLQKYRGQAEGRAAALSWSQAGVLAALLLLGALCEINFLRAFLPALGVYVLALWAKNPKHPRFFLQLFAAFLPAGVCIALQFTGSADGLRISLSLESAWLSVRGILLAAAFPLLVLMTAARKDAFRDPVLALCLLLTAISAAEAALFERISAGINRAGMTAVFLMWIIMLPRYITAVFDYRYERLRLQQDAKLGAVPAALLVRKQTRLNLKSLGILLGIILLLWHLYSGLYSLCTLFSAGGI